MKRPDCTQCQEWELCPFHGDDAPPSTERAVEAISAPDASQLLEEAIRVVREATDRVIGASRAPAKRNSFDFPLRLLGPDDPEVSSDDIYLDPATGGVWAVPRRSP